MSGRVSLDAAAPFWGTSGAAGSGYNADGSIQPAGHGRRSPFYRQQNSTLFNAFEEESVGLNPLNEGRPGEEEEEDDEIDGLTRSNTVKNGGGGRTSMGGYARVNMGDV